VTWAPLFLSAKIASVATIFSVVIGTALALLLRWRRLPARDLVDALVSAPLILPPTVLGYYLIVALGRHSAIGRAWESLTGTSIVFTFTGAVVAGLLGSLPLVVRSVRVGLEAIDPRLVAAARTLGAAPGRVLLTIVVPLAAPGIVAGAMLGFARALGDYGITQMVAGARIDGVAPASIFVMDAMNGGRDDDMRNMAIATTLLGVGLLVAANVLTRRLLTARR
jgi:molybdate transport system permease protein